MIQDQAARQAHGGEAVAPPEHVLTFVFTDVEGSTRLWERSPDAMRRSLERHDAILREAIDGEGGVVVKATGDGVMAMFASAPAALVATLEAQRRLVAEPWPDSCRISVRIGVHSGEAQTRSGDYFGPTVNRAARIMAAAHGGQVIVSSASAALVAGGLPAGMTLRDLGEHRLKDLERSERLFQVVHPAMPAEFAPLATLDRRPNNLPTQMSVFVGRDDELQEIRARLEDESVRLIVLTGPGGTGKTRLALRAAADEVDRFTDGVFFVDLSSATDADSVFGLVAAALGLGQDTDQAPLAEVKRLLKEQEVLLVLDNFEQTISAAPALIELLQDCPQLKLLVTSREALRLRGENVLSVPPLSLPATDGVDSAAEVSRFEAIQLFVERARAVRGDFHLTDDNAAAVVEICRRLDGLPLAIELATARLNLFSPEALRDRLGQRLKLLASGPRDLPARQQTLRATIEWSYQLLDPQEQRLLELVSIFSGATFEAVEAVVAQLGPGVDDGIDAIEALASLLDKSLLRQPDSGDIDPAPRVVMLETIREYATERLHDRPDFAAATCEGHATYYADFAARFLTGLDASSDAARSPVLVTELENLRTAWRFWYGRRDLDRLNQLLDPLWQIYELRGWYHATIGLINESLDVLSDAPPTQQRWEQEVTLRTSLARALTLLRGYTGEVEDAYERVLAMFDRKQQPPQLYPVLKGLLSFHGFRAESDKSFVIAQEMLRLADAQNDPSMRIDAYMGMGAHLAFSGDLERGLEYLDRGIETSETHRYQPRRLQLGIDPRISSLTTSGFLLVLLGRPDSAVGRANRAVALAEELDHPYSRGYALYHAGFLHHWRREPAIVRDRARSVLQLVAVHDLPIWRALGTCLLGAATSELGDPIEGLRLVDEGLSWYQDLRTPPVFWPMIRFLQAGVYGQAGKVTQAMASINEAMGIAGDESILWPSFEMGRADLLLVIDPANVDEATVAYEHAMERAAGFKMRTPQLQAATRLVRMARSPAEREDRLASLRKIHGTFVEGFSTPDLVDAAKLIEESGGHARPAS
jgi:predicted ATPase/class 3 adenylate cyclase